MIIILHGADVDASYKRLSELISLHKNYRLVNLDKNTTKDELQREILEKNLFEESKLIILKNLLTKEKDLVKILEKAQKDQEIICYQNDQIQSPLLTKLTKFAKVENYKIPSKLFYFLDSISPGRKITNELSALPEDHTILWNIQQRFLLLALVKLKIDAELASKIIKRNLAPWQWDKIKSQANKFTKETIFAIYSASLKIDYLIKSGKTNLAANFLAKIMLTKYL